MRQPESPILCIFVYDGPEDEVNNSVQELLSIVADVGGTVYSDEEVSVDGEERYNSMNIKRAGPTLLAGEMLFPTNRIKEVLDGLQKIKKKRIEQANSVGAEILTSACPACNLTLRDAAREMGDSIKIMDIVEYIGMKLDLF